MKCILKIKLMKNKIALITGITGQDGSYLAELLLKKGYTVHGLKRRTSIINTANIDHLYNNYSSEKFCLHYGDLVDTSNIFNLIKKIKPDEIYNLAAQSHVAVSFVTPEYTSNVNAIGTLRILESIKTLGLEKKTKFYQASTSEIFGNSNKISQNEKTKFYPRSPYGISKLFSYWITINYRECYGIHASNGILFNHESPRRGETFITRKITQSFAKISFGTMKKFEVGNLEALRDWGHAKDYVEMQWLILQQKKPDDFVIASGKQFSVRQFIEKCATHLDIKLSWNGKGLNEKAKIVSFNKLKTPKLRKNQIIVSVSKKFFRPSEVNSLKGDATKARKILKWSPQITIDEMIVEMLKADFAIVKKKLND